MCPFDSQVTTYAIVLVYVWGVWANYTFVCVDCGAVFYSILVYGVWGSKWEVYCFQERVGEVCGGA